MKQIILSLLFLMTISTFNLHGMDDDLSLTQQSSFAQLENKINELSNKVTELQLKNEQISELIKKEAKPQGWVAWAKDGLLGKTGVEKLINSSNLYQQMKNEESLINKVSGGCAIKAVDWVSNNPGKALAGAAGTYVLSKGLQKAFARNDGNQSISNVKFPANKTAFNLQEFGKNMRDL